VHALQLAPIGVLARALDNPQLNTLLESMRERTGNSVIYRQGTIRRVMRMLQERQGVAVLIDQHIQSRDAILRGLLRAAGGDDLRGGGAGAADGRAGRARVRAAARRRPLSYDLRASRRTAGRRSPDAIREFTQRCTDVLEMYVRRRPDLWLWMHRRWRDNEPASAHVPGMFPSADSDDNAEL